MHPPVTLHSEALIQHREFVRAIAKQLLRDDSAVDDVAQEVAIATWKSETAKASSDGASRGWFATLARNFARNRQRAEARRLARERSAADAEIVRDGSPADTFDRVETAQRVVAAVMALEEPYRSVLLLRYYEGLDPGAIAATRCENPSTVRAQLSRAHARLRARLERDFGSQFSLFLALERFGGATMRAVTSGFVKWGGTLSVATFASVGVALFAVSSERVKDSKAASTPPRNSPEVHSIALDVPTAPQVSRVAVPVATVATPIAVNPSPRVKSSLQGKGSTEGMCFIPAGKARIGLRVKEIEALALENANFLTQLAASTPARTLDVAAFYLDKCEVTNAQWKGYLDATQQEPSEQLRANYWADGKIPRGHENKPIVFVSNGECEKFAAYYGKRLPTEIEWEYAARGGDGRAYPWGATFDFDGKSGGARANCGATVGSRVVADVGSFPEGASPFGVLDLCGNVWEWTSSRMEAYDSKRTSIEVKTKTGMKTFSADPILSSKQLVIRGGQFDSNKVALLSAVRQGTEAGSWYNSIGFRCARDP